MAELDLSDFLKDASVADLQWLDVDEEKYRAEAVLPKQNLDIKPDLEALWAREGESPVTYLVPNVVPVPNPGISDPHTMGDMSQVHGKLSPKPEEIAKIARLALMQSDDLGRMRSELTRRYPLETLQDHREVLASVLQERGLVGRYYVVSEDFSGVNHAKAEAFINKYAPTARYVLSKTACGGCPHCITAQPSNPGHCSEFNRELVTEVPYTAKLAESVERSQVARGRTVQASEGASAKERIRAAYLAPRPQRSEAYAGQGVNQHKSVLPTPAEAREQLIEASALVSGKRAVEQSAVDAKPVLEFLHREMVKGLSHAEIASSLKLAFDKQLLVRTNPHWGALLKESGLYGVVYTKQASFSDCHDGADFLAKHNPSVRAIVAGAKCGSCIYNKSSCLLYGKPLVKQAADVVTQETVDAVLLEHRTAGRLPAADIKIASSWGGTPSQALKAIHEAVRASAGLALSAPMRLGAMTGFYGNTPEYAMSGVARNEIIKQASRYMNEGLYGQDLAVALRSRFDPRDIVASKDELRKLAAEQGLQGVYYVDPSVYDDYGKGCHEASRLHRSRGVPYIKYGSKCTSCVHQVQTGHCSQINKPLVTEPPYIDKVAQQRAVLASGNSTSIAYADLVNNGASMIAEFDMQNEIVVDVKATEVPRDVTIMFGQGTVKL
jgi:hypothetical protein